MLQSVCRWLEACKGVNVQQSWVEACLAWIEREEVIPLAKNFKNALLAAMYVCI